MRAAAILIVLAVAGCSEVYPFECCSDEECQLDDEEGVCTPYHACAYLDEDCDLPNMPGTGHSYDESAGEDLAGVCVGDEGFPPDE